MPVDPRGGEIDGLRGCRRVSAVPGPIDRVSVYVPPASGRAAACGKRGPIRARTPRKWSTRRGDWD